MTDGGDIMHRERKAALVERLHRAAEATQFMRELAMAKKPSKPRKLKKQPKNAGTPQAEAQENEKPGYETVDARKTGVGKGSQKK